MVNIILAVIAFLFALIFLAMGFIAMVGSAQQRRQCSGQVSGLVTEILVTERKVKNGTVKSYTPVYTFDVKGETCSGKATFATLKKEFKTGEAVTVRYDPANPENSYILEAQQNSGSGSIMMIILGLLCLMGGLAAIT